MQQIYRELRATVDEWQIARKALEEQNSETATAALVHDNLTKQLLAITVQEAVIQAEMAAQKTTGVNPELRACWQRKLFVSQQLTLAQGKLTRAQQQLISATRREHQLKQVCFRELRKRAEEWLWLSDPFGRRGALSHQQSIPVFSQWIESDADFPLFYVARGFAYLNTGNLELALEDLSKPGQTEPQLTATLAAGRGLVLARMREIPRSSAEFGTALRLLPQSPVVEVFLGQTCVDQGKYIEAHKHFKKAANLAKKTPQYQDTLAFYLATREGDDPVSARQAMEHAASACRWTDWQEWQYLDTLAIACAATGDFKMAIQWGEKALGRAPAECQDSLRERLTLFAAKKPYKPQ